MATVLARGRRQVAKLDGFLGGKPPAQAIAQSKASLTKQFRAYVAQRNAEQTRLGKIVAQSRERVLSPLRQDDPTLAREIAEAKKSLKARASKPIAKPRRREFEPQTVIGSQFVLKAHPFDADWTFGGIAHANKNDGTYDVAVQSIGDGSEEAAAGVGCWFWSTEADPLKRFAVFLDYSYDWWDISSSYVAHNNYRTRLGVWGAQEQRWVGQADRDPQWNDGTGWLDHHSGNDQGNVSLEMSFPALAQSWYLAWIWSDALVFGDSGFGGFGAASIHANASVPFMVLGQV
jgi:hypothetical protein